MKRRVIVLLSVILVVSPLLLVSQPDLTHGLWPEVQAIENCPSHGVIFVGNNVVDLNTNLTCGSGELFWKRDGTELSGSRGQEFYRDMSPVKGNTYIYERCCDDGSGSETCSDYDPVTLGEVKGSVCQDLSWSYGEYDSNGGVHVVEGAVLSISGVTLRNLSIGNLTSTISPDLGGDIRIDDSILEDVELRFGAPGNTYIKNSTLSDGVPYPDDGHHVVVSKDADVTISGNTIYTMTIDIFPQPTDADPGPRATISNNTFHSSNVEIEDARSVTTDILGNRFYWEPSSTSENSAISQRQGSNTLIANNTFLRRGSEGTFAKAIELRNDDAEQTGINATIEYNSFSGYNLDSEGGIFLYGHAEAKITGNTFTGNETGIQMMDDDALATIRENCIAGNSAGVRGNYASVDARNNWWGDASGPDITENPDGTGDKITGRYVLFDPWLTTDNCTMEPPPKLTLSLPQDPLPADGMTQIEIHADLTDQQGPITGATVNFSLSPSLGQMWPNSAKTNSQGRATIHYQVPSQETLGGETQVEVSASSGSENDSGSIPFLIEQPSIDRIQVAGIGTLNNMPETGKRVSISVDYTETAGYEVFELVLIGHLGTPVYEYGPLDNQVTIEYVPFTGPGSHGVEKVTAALGYRETASGKKFYSLKHYTFDLFFALDGDHDGNGVPNWFEYWGADGAVPYLKMAGGRVVYNATLGSNTGGAYLPSIDKILVGPRAARYDPGMVIQGGSECPGLNVPPTQGIDNAARVVDREYHRYYVYNFWKNGGLWDGKKDSDDITPEDKRDDLFPADNLPDTLETTIGTQPDEVDSCNLAAINSSYSLNGDQEIYTRMINSYLESVSANDWANPGEQAGGLGITVMEAPVDDGGMTLGSGPAVGVSPVITDDLLVTQPEFASLMGVYTDVGVDTDGDGLYDQLRLSVGVDVSQEEIYNVVAWLEGGSGNQIGWGGMQATLSAGVHTLNLLFDGLLLRESGLDGPYNISMVELRLGPRELLLAAPQDAHTTTAYNLADFDPPDVAFTGTFSDQGIDSGSDGLYDQLRIDIGVDVQESGIYTITGELSGTHSIAVVQASANLTIGVQTLNLKFDGASIYQNRQDGPYQLRALRVEDASGNQEDFILDAYTTDSYTFGEFQHSGTTFNSSGYDDEGVDSDGNGKFDSLRFSLEMDVDKQDTYLLLANLTDGGGKTVHSLARNVDLTAGRHTINLDFFGRAISGHGVDGPYTITGLALFASDGTLVDQHPLPHTTQAYSWTEFENQGFLYLPLISR